MSDVTVAVTITVVYMLASFRVFVVACRQSIRSSEPNGAEYVVALLWPLTLIFVSVTILFFDLETPGFEKISQLPSDQRG